MAPTPLRIAVFFEGTQITDVMGIDIIGNMSAWYINATTAAFPVPNADLLRSQAPEIEIRFVASSLEPTMATPGIKVLPTHTYATCPVDDLDVLLVGGPFPDMRPPESLEMIRRFVARGKGDLVTTCVGSMWVADAGVLKGRKVTTNRGALNGARQAHPECEWVDRRFVVDAKPDGEVDIWSSGGAMAGLDMVAKWCFAKLPEELVRNGLWGLDFDVKGVEKEEYTEALPEGYAG
jgi:transcriptional regulator GlxA family with amidase domain